MQLTNKISQHEFTNSISVYENDVPPYLGGELDSLYGSVYSSLFHFRGTADLLGLNTYVARNHDGIITAIFLFKIENGMLRVANEGMRLQASDVVEFSRFVFENYPSVSAVSFHAVQVSNEAIPFIHQGFFCTEDFIAELPNSRDEYLSSLGKSTKKTLKWSLNRIERTFPSFSFQVHERENIREEDVRAIVEMNHARMSVKGKVSHLDEAKVQENLRLLRECGALCLATIDGKVCAGTTVFRIGDSVISRINAHDPKYDPYRLGMVCCYLAACASIDRGARRFHFGHTKYDYKVSLGGRFQAYEHIVIYRSRLHFLGKMHHAIRVAAEGYRVLFSRKLLESAESESGIFWDTTRKGLQLWRSLKKMTRRDSHIQSH